MNSSTAREALDWVTRRLRGHAALLASRALIFGLGVCVWALGLPPAFAQTPLSNTPRIAFALEDGPRTHATALMSPQQRNAAMLKALADHNAKAVLFVTVNYGANEPAGLELARAWGAAGHSIGNHTMNHIDLDDRQVTLAQYQKEVLDCDEVIKTLPGYKKWYRFTFLREGTSIEKRQGMRDFLAANNYKNAYVTMNTDDWRINDAMSEAVTIALTRNVNADVPKVLAPFKAAYLDHVWQRAQGFDKLGQTIMGRRVPMVPLMHHNLINALFLGDVIAMFKQKGWAIITPEEAMADPAFQLHPQNRVAGQNLLIAMGRALGLNVNQDYNEIQDNGDAMMAALAKAESCAVHLLLVEDDLDLGAALQRALKGRGISSEWVRRVKEATAYQDMSAFDCAVLDLGLPDGDGHQVLKHWRESGFTLPVIMLTARDALDSRIAGLDGGADDYLIKAIAPEELVSRIHAVVRRATSHRSSVWRIGPLYLSLRSREVLVNELPVSLSPKEFKILEILATQAGAVVAKHHIANSLAPLGEATEFNALEVHIHNLRKKLGVDIISTVRGVGYRLAA
jgi:peptidoglycan-N-acetylglucosamine deacetylase